MYIIDAIPLSRLPRHLPQTFTYFSSENLAAGVLVMAKIRTKEVPAIVILSEDAKTRRIEIKKSGFELKPIGKIISRNPILTPRQIALARWVARYYIEPLSLVFKTITPKLPQKSQKISDSAALTASQTVKPPSILKQKPLLLKTSGLADSIEYLASEIEKTISNNFQVLILSPTLASNQNVSDILQNKLADHKIAVISKKSGAKKNRQNYAEIQSGQTQIIAGVRSSVFLPFLNLGLIIIVSESDDSHKQWEGHPLYDAREVAEKLAEIFGAKLVLESQTPSAASTHKAQNGEYEFKEINKENTARPAVEIIDMQKEALSGNYSILSEQMKKKLGEIVANKKRALLFLNRRGAANFIVCKNCGYIVECPACKIPLVYHPAENREGGGAGRLTCNHCNFSSPPPRSCQKCGGVEIRYLGLGTKKIEDRLKKMFPAANILRLDADNAKTSEEEEKILDSFRKNPGILVGTQRILNASGMPEISFVGIVSFDAVLAIPDFKIEEKIFSLFRRLAERGSGIAIQTYNPENPAIRSLSKLNWDEFVSREIENRRILFYPPFSKIIKLTYAGTSEKESKAEALRLADLIRQKIYHLDAKPIAKNNLKIMGPAPAFIFHEKGYYNWRIIIRAKGDDPVYLDKIKIFLEKTVPPSWKIDISPESLL